MEEENTENKLLKYKDYTFLEFSVRPSLFQEYVKIFYEKIKKIIQLR